MPRSATATRKARNPALVVGYKKGPGRGARASASAVREFAARPRTALIRIAQRPPGLHAERPWRRTAGLSGSVRHLNNERKRLAFRVDAGRSGVARRLGSTAAILLAASGSGDHGSARAISGRRQSRAYRPTRRKPISPGATTTEAIKPSRSRGPPSLRRA